MGLGRLRDNSASGVPSITHLSTLHTQSLLGPGCHLSCLLILVGVGVGVPLWAAGICSVRLSAQHLPFQNSCLTEEQFSKSLSVPTGWSRICGHSVEVGVDSRTPSAGGLLYMVPG